MKKDLVSFERYTYKGRLIKYINESSLIGKTLHCGCKEMGSTPISR